jgi:hypothetical protein
MTKSKLAFASIAIVAISVFVLFSCINKRKTKSLNKAEQDSLKETLYRSYFTSINDSLSTDTALFKAYKNELQEQVFHYMSENAEAMDEYIITNYSSQGEILNTNTYSMAPGGNEPLVPLIVDMDESQTPKTDSSATQWKEGVYYQSADAGVIKLSPEYYNKKPKQKVIMMPQSYYNRLTATSYRNVNASGEQNIINQLNNSFGGLGAESDIINTLNNSDPTWGADIVLDWTKQNFDYLNALNNNTYQPGPVPIDNTKNPYLASGSTVVTHNPPPVVFGAGASVSSSGAVMVGTNKIHANCMDFNDYVNRFGVTDTKKNYPMWMGVTVLHSWKMQITYTDESTVVDGKNCIKATKGRFSFLQPDYNVFMIEWIPTNKACEPVAKIIHDKTRKHEAKHVKDLWDIVAMVKSDPTLIPDFEVCGTGNTVSETYHSKILDICKNIEKKLTKKFDDFSLLVDMETIGYCGCED